MIYRATLRSDSRFADLKSYNYPNKAQAIVGVKKIARDKHLQTGEMFMYKIWREDECVAIGTQGKRDFWAEWKKGHGFSYSRGLIKDKSIHSFCKKIGL